MDIDINTTKILYLRRIHKFFSFKYDLFCSKYQQVDKELTNELEICNNNSTTNNVIKKLEQKGEYYLRMNWLHKIDNFVLDWVKHNVIRDNQSAKMTIPDNEYIISYIEYEIILLLLHECSGISLECEKFVKEQLFTNFIDPITHVLDKSKNNIDRDKLIFQFVSFVDTVLVDRHTIYELHEMCKSFDSLNADYIDKRVYEIINKKYNSIKTSYKPIEISSRDDIDDDE